MADTSDIDAAVMKRLSGDAALLALMPNGVYWDVPAEQTTRYVLVATVTHDEARTFHRRSWEDLLYFVKAVGFSQASPDMKGAAARIDALLEDATLIAAGYTAMVVVREGHWTHRTERDDSDPTNRWFHRGAYYRVLMSCD